ncbi:hypothetical protein AB3A53_004313 [Vibrio vulnificus]
MDVVFELLKLGAVGLIAGLFTSFIALKDYRYKKWWELRVSAYQTLIEALSDLVYYYERLYNAELLKQELNPEFEKKLEHYHDLAFPKVRKAADLGAFVFSEDVNSVLSKYMESSWDKHPTYGDFLDMRLYQTKLCLKAVVNASKSDLKVKRRWL